MKKILFYTNIPVPYRVDFFNELGKYCELTVLFEADHSTERDDSWKKYKFENFRGIIMHGKRTAVDMAFCPEVIKHIRKENYDHIVVTIMASLTAILAVTWLRLHHIPYMYEGDGGFVHNRSRLRYWLKKYIISNAQLCFSTSRVFDDYCQTYGATKDKIIRYPFSSVWNDDIISAPVSKQQKQELRSELGIEEEHILISVGQMIYRKGFDILLQATSVLDSSWGIFLVGGKITPELEKIIVENHLKNIHFVNFVSKKMLWKYYQASDLFVLPTREDPWGLVVNEAVANGLPVITTRQCIAGLELVEEGKNGFLYDCEDVFELKRLLVDIQNCDFTEMSKCAIETAREYTIETMTEAHKKELCV